MEWIEGLKDIRRKWNGLVPLEEWTTGENLQIWQLTSGARKFWHCTDYYFLRNKYSLRYYYYYYYYYYYQQQQQEYPIPATVLSKAWACGPSLT